MAKEFMDGKVEQIAYELGRLGRPFFFPVGIPLQIEIEGASLRMNSVSLGYSPGSYLIIKYPTAPISISTVLSKGKKITVRYVCDGNVFAFESELITVAYETVNALFISYPVRIASQGLRDTRRTPCYLRSKLIQRNSDHAPETPLCEGVIVDISATGCAFTRAGGDPPINALAHLHIGDAIVVLLELPGTEGYSRILGHVKRMQRDTEQTSIGIKFEAMEETLKTQLVDFIGILEKFIPPT